MAEGGDPETLERRYEYRWLLGWHLLNTPLCLFQGFRHQGT